MFSVNPAFLNCFLALVTFPKLLPASFAAEALAPSLSTPTTLSANAPSGISTLAPSIGVTSLYPHLQFAIAIHLSLTTPCANSNIF